VRFSSLGETQDYFRGTSGRTIYSRLLLIL